MDDCSSKQIAFTFGSFSFFVRSSITGWWKRVEGRKRNEFIHSWASFSHHRRGKLQRLFSKATEMQRTLCSQCAALGEIQVNWLVGANAQVLGMLQMRRH